MTKYYESLSYTELEKQAEQYYKDDKLVSALILYAQMIKKAFCQKQIDYCKRMITFIKQETERRSEHELKVNLDQIMNENNNIEGKS